MSIRDFKNRCVSRILTKQRKNDKCDYSAEKMNRWLYNQIKSEESFVLTRIGYAELSFFAECVFHPDRVENGRFKNAKMAEIFSNNPEQIRRYIGQLIEVYSESDAFVCWYNSFVEKKLIRKFACQDALTSDFRVLEPFFINEPWTKALEGKKVLVLSPFSETIEKQYTRINLIHPNGFMPKFELQTVQSVWYAPTPGKDDRFACWNDALEYLKQEITKCEFDIALLSCGPFGVPLLDTIYKMGKQGIYVGGALQLYFGVRGNRWDQYSDYQKLYNEYWVRPGDDNRPKGANSYEKGCYW